MGRFQKLLAWILLPALLLGFLLRDNLAIQRETVPLTFLRLPASFDGFRVAEIADLHGRVFGKDSRQLLRQVRKARPDLIAIDGDLFDENTDLSMLPPLLTGLTAIAPTFYVTGNHEWQLAELPELLSSMEALGVRVLRNDYTVLTRGPDRLVVAGVHDPCGYRDQKSPEALMEDIRQKEGDDAFVLMLAHRNDALSMWSALGADLVLAGHAHGGVVRLPFIGGVFGNGRKLFPDFDAGPYFEKGTCLYVSRGLGPAGFRLFNRPHLPILELKAGNREHFVNYSPECL